MIGYGRGGFETRPDIGEGLGPWKSVEGARPKKG